MEATTTRRYIKEQFVTDKVALKLKEKGFDEKCLAYYNTDPYLKVPAFNLTQPFDHVWVLPAPLWQQAIMWLLKKSCGMYPMMRFTIFSDGSGCFTNSETKLVNDVDFSTIEEGINEFLELI